jgi:hypothetical protein
MADLVIPAGAVAYAAGNPTETKQAAAAITAGKVVRYDATNPQKFNLADKNTLAASFAEGIAVCDAEISEGCVVARHGSLITFAGAILTAGVFYFLSDTGGICPFADVAALDYYTCVGYAESTTTLRVFIIVTQVAKA